MPLLGKDGDPTTGFIRKKRILIENVLIAFIESRSPMIRNYAIKISQATGLPIQIVKKSKPYKSYLKKLLGI